MHFLDPLSFQSITACGHYKKTVYFHGTVHLSGSGQGNNKAGVADKSSHSIGSS